MRIKARLCRPRYSQVMNETTLPVPYLAEGPRAADRARAPRPAAAAVFLPKEHGSWSLALEPLALALWLAPSAPGAALAAAAFAGFLARRPLKAAWAPECSERRRAAREALVLLTTLVVAGGFEVLVLGDTAALWPVLLVVPAGALFGYFDAQGEGRAAAAELAGSATFAVLPAAFATLAGWPAVPALALAVLALVRSGPTVLAIRAFLRQRKGERAGFGLPVLAAVAGLVTVGALAAAGWLPWLVATGPTLLLSRAIWFAGPWRPAWSARHTGMVEAGLGLAYLLIVGLAFRDFELPLP